MHSTRVSRHANAPRAAVHRALLDADAVARWRVPEGMAARVHAFDGREGGAFRVSLTYDLPAGTGKTNAQTDTYHGGFVRLVPDEQVVEEVEFETGDPALRATKRDGHPHGAGQPRPARRVRLRSPTTDPAVT